MADDEGKASNGSKHRWRKLLGEVKSRDSKSREADSGSSDRQDTFKLDENVVDFLKPSTEKPNPKLNISIARRWPNAQEVRAAGAASSQTNVLANGRPKRRKGLTVGFVQTPPEIIGEGGDESLEPSMEISRQKNSRSRSKSDARLNVRNDEKSGPHIQQGVSPPGDDYDGSKGFTPRPLRRAQTELSPTLQKKMVPQSADESLTYLSNSFSQSTAFKSSTQEHQRMSARPPPRTESGGHDLDEGTGVSTKKQYLGLPTRTNDSPVARKSRDMSMSEGMALRRASTLNEPKDDDDKHEHSRSSQNPQESTSHSQVIVPLSAQPTLPKIVSTPDSGMNIGNSASPTEPDPSPFDDPKYINRKSREVSPSSMQQSHHSSRAPRQGNTQLSNPRNDQQPSQDERLVESVQPHSLLSPSRRQDQPPPNFSRPPNQHASRPPNLELEQNYIQGQASSSPPQAPGNDPIRGQPSQTETSYIHASTSYDQQRQQIPQITRPPPEDRIRMPWNDNRLGSSQPYFRSDESKLQPGSVPSTGGSQSMVVPQPPSRGSSRSPMRDQYNDRSTAQRSGQPLMSIPNGSSSNINPSSRQSPGSRNSPQDARYAQMLPPNAAVAQPIPSSTFTGQSQGRNPQNLSPQTSRPSSNKATASPMAPGSRQSPADYFATARAPPVSSAGHLRQEVSGRPDSSGSARSGNRPSPSSQALLSPLPTVDNNPAAESAYSDFESRVTHMKGVFRLTAEKEWDRDDGTPTTQSWVRTALWWYIKGKAGLEVLFQRRPRSPIGEPQELLTQAHVDIAKTWWIVTEHLDGIRPLEEATPQVRTPEAALGLSVEALKAHLKSISLSMGKSNLMPPTQSLIQGQDMRIWLNYPQFAPNATAALGGHASKSVLADDPELQTDPYEILPLSDTRDFFCYGRYSVETFVNTDESNTDRVVLPCVLSMLRGKRDYQTSFALASQSDLVNIRIDPRQMKKDSLTWQDVSWKANSSGLTIHVPGGFDISVRMQERDFRAVWNLSEYARNVDRGMRAEQDEKMIHESRLAELQYVDSSNSSSFPTEKIRGCLAIVYERSVQRDGAGGPRKMHNGFRLLLLTDPAIKTLNSVSHDICTRGPLYFEFLTDTAANGTTAMVIRIYEDNKRCRALLVFPNAASRQALYDVLHGLAIGPNETVVGKMTLKNMTIEPASQSNGLPPSVQPSLQWQKLYVFNGQPDDQNTRNSGVVESESLRIVARHATGCITDRLNLNKGEMLLRLHSDKTLEVQLFRQPQKDITMSADTKHSSQPVIEGTEKLLNLVQNQHTIRTLTFTTPDDLHAFQLCITGFTVQYDGLGSTFGISRRRMVVPIYKKWEASNVRLQVVSKDTVFQILAFMEDFSHADAMCFQVKSTDNIEKVKGDGKHKKWAIKLVDAKFSLPSQEKGEMDTEEALRRRFVNLEGLDYAEEHDDITIGFDTEDERDRFAQALPAAATMSRGITLKRRI